MLRYPALFLVLASIAGALGYGGLAGGGAEFSKTLFFVFLALAALGCLINRLREPVEPLEPGADLMIPEPGADLTIPVGDLTIPVVRPVARRPASSRGGGRRRPGIGSHGARPSRGGRS
jgi:uncharacterized membrane protein YtjA (UPF0391 family)